MSSLFSFAALALTLAPAPQSLPAGFEEKIEGLVAPWKAPGVPGGVLGVVLDGNIIFQKAYGLANLEHQVPAKLETVYDIGSIGKQFTCFSILLLQEEGKLSVNDPIGKYVTGLAPKLAALPLHHLMHHTSGLRDYFTLMPLKGIDLLGSVNDAQALEIIRAQRDLDFEPGTRFSYSNTGYFLLGQTVQAVTGRSIARFWEDRIFKPLNMTTAYALDDPTLLIPNSAQSYMPNGNGYIFLSSNMSLIGDGGITMSLADLMKWESSFRNPVLGKNPQKLVEDALRPSKFNDGSSTGYAAGLFIDDLRGVPRVQHGGNFMGFNAYVARYGKTGRLSVYVLSNDGRHQANVLANRVAELFFAGELATPTPPAAVTWPAEKRAKLAGKYVSLNGVEFEVSVDGEKWKVKSPGRPDLAWYPINEDTVQYEGSSAQAQFKFKDQMPTEALVRQGNNRVPLYRLGTEPLKPEDIAGTYRSAELNLDLVVRIEGGKAVVSGPVFENAELRPLDQRWIAAPGWLIEAIRPGRRVTEFRLNSQRAKGLRFIRK